MLVSQEELEEFGLCSASRVCARHVEMGRGVLTVWAMRQPSNRAGFRGFKFVLVLFS